MKNEEKILKGRFIFDNFGLKITNTAKIILEELKTNSSLNEEKIVEILLEYHNLGETQTKLLYPCPSCNNSGDKCIACDELLEELNYFKEKFK